MFTTGDYSRCLEKIKGEGRAITSSNGTRVSHHRRKLPHEPMHGWGALLAASFTRLIRVDPGFDADRVVAVRLGHVPSEYDAARRELLVDRLYTREIGLRIALGATQATTRWRIVAETLTLAAIGIGIGLAAALGAGQVVSAFLFGISPRDPATLASVAVILLTISFAAAYFPARTAAAVDPMRALRAD